MKTLSILAAALLVITLSSCARHPQHYGYEKGPPPHAPAHGYRAKHKHHDLIYDSALGAYLVKGYADHYYLDDRYYRYHDGLWLFSRYLDDDWRRIDYDDVPYRLRQSYDKDRDHRSRGRGYDDRGDHPGKGRGRDKDGDWD